MTQTLQMKCNTKNYFFGDLRLPAFCKIKFPSKLSETVLFRGSIKLQIVPVMNQIIHTQLAIKSLQSALLSQFLISLNVVCVNFIHKRRDLRFKVDSKRHIFLKTFHGNFIYIRSFCQKSTEWKLRKIYFLYFVLMSGLGLEYYLPHTSYCTTPTSCQL